MLLTERQRLRDDVDAWTEHYGKERSAMLPILQRIQEKYLEVSPYSMQVVADHLGIHPVEVYSVVTFFSFLHESCRGKFVIRLCQTITCDMAGKDRIACQLRNDLGIDFGQTTPDGKFSLEWASCIGMCDQGPALLVNDQVFTKVTPDMVHDIVETCRRSFGPLAFHRNGDHSPGVRS
jgi:[NiFe] hydrogenase diaphorase moiety large subunit